MVAGRWGIVLALCLILSADTMTAAPSRNQWLPDPKMTPGATNPDITQDNIDETICNHHGWSTKSIRPPTSYTNKIKLQLLKQIGKGKESMHLYELDHLEALTLGGHPTDIKNLWLEPWDGEWNARDKDKLEQRLNKLVCNGTLTLKEAQAAISENWIAAYKKFLN